MILETSSKTIMTPNNILILGKGYIGNYISNHLKTNGFSVKIISSHDVNYHDTKILGKYILNNAITHIINCSGFTGTPNIDEAEDKKELCWELNVMSPLRINQFCHDFGVNYLHISSGCIYTYYDEVWSEEDSPNFGLFSNESSFYSKSKHAFELMSSHLKGKVIRIRMPFGPDNNPRNYLTKIRKYDNLIEAMNSRTYIPDLCNFVEQLFVKRNEHWKDREIFNVVNPHPLWVFEITNEMTNFKLQNPNWSFVPIEKLNIKAGRSNCVISCEKSKEIYEMKSEMEALQECLKQI